MCSTKRSDGPERLTAGTAFDSDTPKTHQNRQTLKYGDHYRLATPVSSTTRRISNHDDVVACKIVAPTPTKGFESNEPTRRVQ